MIPPSTRYPGDLPTLGMNPPLQPARNRAGLTHHALESHITFVMPLLEAGMDVLHIGCGAGALTRELAEAVLPGSVTGVDTNSDAIRRAVRLAEGREITNVRFASGEAGCLPFPDGTFDLVYAPGICELGDLEQAVAEFRRVLRPGGIAALCDRAWDRLDVEPFSLELAEAFNDYRALLDLAGHGSDDGLPWIDSLQSAGFGILDTGVTFEDVENPEYLADAFAVQLELAGNPRAATTLLHWADAPDCRMTQMWRHVLAVRGDA